MAKKNKKGPDTNKKLTLSIVPSVSPGLAAENVKKIQCFCFSEQTLGPYETQEWPVRFYVDSELSENVNLSLIHI